MATFTVEDGTGVVGANSYSSTDAAAEYHAMVGTGDDWQTLMDAATDEGMLVQATRAIESRYSWNGTILTVTQGLGLPRADLTLPDGRILTSAAQVALAADATAWLALRLGKNQTATGTTGATSESLGDWSVTYGGASGATPDYSPVDAILAPLIASGGFAAGNVIMGRTLQRWT